MRHFPFTASLVAATLVVTSLAVIAAPRIAEAGQKQAGQKTVAHAEYDAMVAAHAQANNVPEALVHRVILRESRYQPHLVGHGGTIGLMQIKLATARSLGYTGDAAGLHDPQTNLTYGVKYLAGAYRAANGDHARAVHFYSSGYYYAAKQQRLAHAKHANPAAGGLALASTPQKAGAVAPADARAEVPSPSDDPANSTEAAQPR
jgi:soluble lytic murein transglycosylase-like protein